MAGQAVSPDARLLAELRVYGEDADTKLPINKKKRDILRKKLNHLKAKSNQNLDRSKTATKSLSGSSMDTFTPNCNARYIMRKNSVFGMGFSHKHFLDESTLLESSDESDTEHTTSDQAYSRSNCSFFSRHGGQSSCSKEYVSARTSPLAGGTSSAGPTMVDDERSRVTPTQGCRFLMALLLNKYAIVVVSVVLLYTYLAETNRWTSSPDMYSFIIGTNDELLLCPDNLPGLKCYDRGEVDRSLLYIKNLFELLSARKGEVLCETQALGYEVINASRLMEKLIRETKTSSTADRLYKCCLDHIIANPHWQIRALKEDMSAASNCDEVVKLESAVGSMGFWCRLMRSLTTVLYGIFIVFMIFVITYCGYFYMQRKQKQIVNEQKEVYAMVENIIGVLKDHHMQSKKDNSSEHPYLVVQHVRDQLLPPAQRRKLQSIWDKAFDFISAHESRIRLETRLIHGDEFEVWQWLPQTSNNGKIWQGQAFGEFNENGSREVKYSPTPCLKIRNMFDSNVECEEGWEANVMDSVLEKLDGVGPVVHICVDADSSEGLVYLKCSSLEAAGKARLELHGWWFDGRLVTVKHLKLDRYHKRWPEAIHANNPLRPSTNSNRSLSQPYHRSSLEMT